MRRTSDQNLRPRELRRRVLLPARVHTQEGWSDACILNVSSSGMMIHAKRPVTVGWAIELRHQDHAISAQVVWRDGAKAGLRADHRVPIEDIVVLSQAIGLQLTAGPTEGERRKRRRDHDQSRLIGRSMQFASITLLGAFLASGAYAAVEHAFAVPLQYVSATLQR